MRKKEIMKSILTLSTIVSLLFAAFSCHSPTAPKQNTPPDTTSNNFAFQTFTFGADNTGSSHLSDVAIVSDSNIWCVGAVYLDSANGAPDPNAYNAVHWDGSSWELKEIQFYTFCGQQQTGSYPANAVLSLGDSIVWIASINSQIAILKSNIQTKIMCVPVSISKMWAASKNEVYTVGTIGQIGHYQNGSWQKIESGTTLDITDIWGSSSPSQILAVANDLSGATLHTAIIQINNNNANIISSLPVFYPLTAVWFVPNQHYYVGGSGLYEKHLLSDSLWKNGVYDITQYYVTAIRGNALNDVFVAGSYGELLHWNGARWKSFIQETNLSSGSYAAIAVKGNLVIAVGLDNGKAIILKGTR